MPYDADMQADFDDLRFTDSSGAELGYFLESKTDASSAVIWVKVSNIAIGSITKINMYYGNSSASSGSNGDNVFAFFDDFNDNSLNTTKWQTRGSQANKISESTGKLRIVSENSYASWQANVASRIAIPRDDYSLEYEYKRVGSDSYGYIMTGWTGASVGESTGYRDLLHGTYHFGTSNTCLIQQLYEDGSIRYTNPDPSITRNINYYFRSRLKKTGGSYNEYSTNGTSYTLYYNSSYSTESNLLGFGASLYRGSWEIDNVKIRKWSNTEPIVSFGTEVAPINSSGVWQSSTDPDAGAIDLVWNGGWGTPNGFEADVNLPANTSVSFDIRSSQVGGASDANWSSWQNLGSIDANTGTGERTLSITNESMPGGSLLPIGESRYIQIKANFESRDNVGNPALNEFRIIYLADNNAPENPTNINGYLDDTKQDFLADLSWGNSRTPYFEWSGAEDSVGESGVKGYWVYFGTDETADPMTAGNWQTGNSYQASIDEVNSGKTYYLAVSTEDYAENRYINGSPNYFKEFTYKFDFAKPDAPSNISVNPFGWSTINNFDFSWSESSDPLSNGDASGIAGYQYKNGPDAEWSVTIADRFLNDVEAYQNGQNVFYVRAVDNAGNVSGTPRGVNYYFNADAPEAPTSVSVSPQNSQENSFTFRWSLPPRFNGSIKKYYYSVNSLPTEQTTTSFSVNNPPDNVEIDGSGNVSLGSIPAASQQGLNTFYVVAMDDSENINFNNYAQIQFECNTPAPGSPVGVEIFDTSNRDLQKYSVALSWEAPEFSGVGFAGYIIERSEDNDTWAEVGSGTSNSYIDVGLSSRLYYYRVKSKDNSNNVSAPSTVVSITPTGRFTSPPELTDGPTIEYKISSAKITWLTDREASSFVEIGENSNYGLTQGQFDFTKKHEVNLDNLKPDTVYHYRVKYVDQDGNIGYSSDATFKTEPAPRAANVKIYDIRLDSAVITWNTTASAQCSVLLGKGSNYSTTLENVSGGFTTSHSVRLSDLDHSSKYHFAVKIKDIDENEVVSDDYVFETLKFPKISVIRLEPLKEQATATIKFTWESNVPTSSIVEYTPEGGRTQEAVSSKLKTKHEIVVSGLLDNTFYSTRIQGRDQFGNLASSDNQRFKTDYDTRPPKVSKVTNEAEIIGYGTDAKGQIVVYWETDEPASSQIEYGIGSGGDSYTNKTQEDTTRKTSHVVIISDLKTSAPYHFRAVSRDESGNEGYSDNYSALTGQATDSVLDIILQTLNSSIGWIFNR